MQLRIFHLTFGIPLWPGQGSMPAAQNLAFCVLKDGTPLSPGHVSMLNRINFKCVFDRICTCVWPCQVLHAFSNELIFVAFKGVIPLHGHTFSVKLKLISICV